MPPNRAQRRFTLALAIIIVARLIFIAHDEIRAAPYDEAAYIGQAAAWYWKNGYSDWTYSRQPGYPLFLALGSLLGIPARLFIEAAWIGMGLLLIRVVRAAGLGRVPTIALFTLLLFHPLATQLFCHALADNLYTIALLSMLAALAMALSRTSRVEIKRWGILAGATGATAGITRQETVLVYVLFCIAALLIVKMRFVNKLPARLAKRRLLFACLIPLGISISTEHAVRLANFARIGAYVTYDWSLPGFKSLYRTMLSITPDSPRLRVPIPKDVRDKAAAASPEYAKLLAAMSNQRMASYWNVGSRTTGIAGEPGSFNLWLMRDAVWLFSETPFRNAREVNDTYQRIADDIRKAQDEGRLPRRWAPLSFIPPDWGQLALDVPSSIPTCWQLMTHIGFERGDPYPVGEVERLRFDSVALRRKALMNFDNGSVLHRTKVVERFDNAKRALAAILPALSWAALAAAVIGSIAAQWVRKRLPAAWYILMSLLWAAFALRLLLVATLDATGVLASHRYVFPNAVLLVPLGVLGAFAVFEFAKATFEKPKPAPGTMN